MSEIKNKNQETMKNSMKSGDKQTLQFTRNLHAAIRKKEIDDRKDLDDAEVMKLIGTMLKQREESITQFRAGGREELAVAEEAEAQYLRQFMPAQMSADEIKVLVKKAVQDSGAASVKDLGKVMKIIVPLTQGKADGKLVNQLVKEALDSSTAGA